MRCWQRRALDVGAPRRDAAALRVTDAPPTPPPTSRPPKVVDVFAMPQSGTGVSVEAVDPVFQTKMLDMLKQVGR